MTRVCASPSLSNHPHGPKSSLARRPWVTAVSLVFAAGSGLAPAFAQPVPPLPPVPVPLQNPITEPKRLLGKALFWDEQLSSDNTVACATCHLPQRSGTDPRRQRNPGFDGLFNTPDDIFGSPGVVRQDAAGSYKPDNAFALGTQATVRAANTALMAAFAPQVFWDGRAGPTFSDPQTGQVLIPNGGALENQVLAPPLSDVEMAHEGRNWNQISAKLATAKPLALATQLTTDLDAALNPNTSYGDLFQAAFGSPAITPARIAMAIATYERTLVPNQTPWDRFNAGDVNALTPQQQQGFQAFQTSRCNACHVPPQFTGNGFRNIGLRPPSEDVGQQAITGNAADRGKFKVPSLRNVGRKNTFMHNGMFTTVTDVIRFYARAPGAPRQFPENQDPIMQQVNVPPQAAVIIEDFIVNGLADPRVTQSLPPFDHPTLWSTRPTDVPTLQPGGTAGSGGQIPGIISLTPAFIGNAEFKLGLQRGLGGATARLVMSDDPPVNGVLSSERTAGTIELGGTGPGAGLATLWVPIPQDARLAGRRIFFQWIITDAGAVGGQSRSNIASVPFFCAGSGCSTQCVADVDDGSGLGWPDGGVGIEDMLYYLALYETGSPLADTDNGTGTGSTDGGVGVEDLLYYLNRYQIGC